MKKSATSNVKSQKRRATGSKNEKASKPAFSVVSGSAYLPFNPNSVRSIVMSLDKWVNRRDIPKHLRVSFANAAYEIWEQMNEKTRPQVSDKTIMPLF